MRETTLINSLIQKETEIIKSYEGFLNSNPDNSFSGTIRESISRHNNHIETLKNISGR